MESGNNIFSGTEDAFHKSHKKDTKRNGPPIVFQFKLYFLGRVFCFLRTFHQQLFPLSKSTNTQKFLEKNVSFVC